MTLDVRSHEPLRVASLNGLPFVSPSFSSRTILAAVAALRLVRARRLGLAPTASDSWKHWLQPDAAVRLWPERRLLELPPLSSRELAMVKRATDEIVAVLPDWVRYFALPVRYTLTEVTSLALSASINSWPQHIMLSPQVLDDGPSLREQLVHETCHQWMYLIEEVWSLSHDSDSRHTLPSGTPNRSLPEVIGAAHVASALSLMYDHAAFRSPSRAAELRRYGLGCIEILNQNRSSLTVPGEYAMNQIEECLCP